MADQTPAADGNKKIGGPEVTLAVESYRSMLWPRLSVYPAVYTKKSYRDVRSRIHMNDQK